MKNKVIINNPKVLIVHGSPRKNGYSSFLAGRAAKGIADAGGTHRDVFLHGLRISPCSACNSCRKKGARYCVIDDDMARLYPEIVKSPAILLAGPVYWFTLSAQTKLFLDRFYGLDVESNHCLRGKRIGAILSYGDSDPYRAGAVNAINTIRDMFRYTESDLVGVVYGTEQGPAERRRKHPAAEEAYRLGCKLTSQPPEDC